MRKEAGGCLVNLLKDVQKIQKKPECRALLERICSEVIFCPDKETRKFLLDVLYKNHNLQEPLPADQHTEHLSTAYRTQTLEISKTTIHQSLSCFVSYGMFQRRKVMAQNVFTDPVRVRDLAMPVATLLIPQKRFFFKESIQK